MAGAKANPCGRGARGHQCVERKQQRDRRGTAGGAWGPTGWWQGLATGLDARGTWGRQAVRRRTGAPSAESAALSAPPPCTRRGPGARPRGIGGRRGRRARRTRTAPRTHRPFTKREPQVAGRTVKGIRCQESKMRLRCLTTIRKTTDASVGEGRGAELAPPAGGRVRSGDAENSPTATSLRDRGIRQAGIHTGRSPGT